MIGPKYHQINPNWNIFGDLWRHLGINSISHVDVWIAVIDTNGGFALELCFAAFPERSRGSLPRCLGVLPRAVLLPMECCLKSHRDLDGSMLRRHLEALPPEACCLLEGPFLAAAHCPLRNVWRSTDIHQYRKNSKSMFIFDELN